MSFLTLHFIITINTLSANPTKWAIKAIVLKTKNRILFGQYIPFPTAQKIKFSIKGFFIKCDQIRRKL